MMLWKCCTQYASKFGKPSRGHRTPKGPFSFQFQRKAMPKTTALISHASKAMLKILQARLQQYVNWELPDCQAGFRKGRGTRDQIVSIHWIIENARESQKKQESSREASTSDSLTTLKPLTLWITTNCGKFLKRWEYQTTLPTSWETSWEICRSRRDS